MPHEAVAAAQNLAPRIEAARMETEAGRRLPDEIVEALVRAGLFRLAVPADLGGFELDPPTALEVFEELAGAEASVAWLVWNSALPALFGRFLSDDARRHVFGDPDLKYGSSTRPTGRAVATGDGYSVSGRWSLVSGCMHADWLTLTSMVVKDGEVEMLESGAPHMRMAFLPTDSCEIVDTWHVGGLRGTGSHDVVAENVFVPGELTFSPMDPVRSARPIDHVPIVATMTAGHASMCLGMASRAVEDVIELARTKVSVDPVAGLPQRAINQFRIAEASTMISALRSEVRASLGALWARAERGEDRSLDEIATARSAAVTTARRCRTIVTELYETAGSPALYVDSGLERRHRDIHAAMQHVVVQRTALEDCGQVRFGMQPSSPIFAL